MTTLLVIRHGNTFDAGDVIRRVGARTDLPLSSSGREQAERLGVYLRKRFPRIDGLIHGPLLRQRQTAELLASKYDVPPRERLETDALNETDYGEDDGAPEEQVVARVGEEALKRWESEAVPPPGWHVDPVEQVKSWRGFAAYVTQRFSAPGSVVMAVTSNGAARFAPVALLPQDSAKPENLKLRTTAFAVFKLGDKPEATSLLEWNVRPSKEGGL